MAGFTEKQLGQISPSVTTAVSAYSVPDNTIGIVKNIVVCNTSTATIRFSIYVDNDGTTYDKSTALHFEQLIRGKQTVRISGFDPIATAGNLAVQTSVASGLTFTINGSEIAL